MKVLEDLAALRAWRATRGELGFVPTMGALHEGHLTLVRRARQAAGQAVLVSIFVNPTQFGPSEDLASYPRTLERDLELCRETGCDAVYAPGPEDMYRAGATSFVEVGAVAEPLCGQFRPGHFRGVATVVAKLFLRAQPQRAYFGEKDYQQLQVIRTLVRDLDFPVEVVGVPTVRETDGLAMSSRNLRLSPSERLKATRIYAALQAGPSPEAAREVLRAAGIEPQYLELVDPDTLLPKPWPLQGRGVLAVAAYVGNVRLIDNLAFEGA
ncbi:pantoate--beta-alanine ligase [bacterium CPR1]|nr:pantoate--beta-alanine ligase [bacterium CPR1]